MKKINIKKTCCNVNKLVISFCLLLLFITGKSYSQIENVPISHPIYKFLQHEEIAGNIEYISLARLPLQKKEIIDALKQIRNNKSSLTNNELTSLEAFEREFGIIKAENSVLFYSKSDSTQVISARIISNDEKYIYHYKDSANSVSIVPLGSFELIGKKAESEKLNSVSLGTLGFRLNGTLSNVFGYYLQATNGSVLAGDRVIALEDEKLHQNIKFTRYDSDFDFTESHVNLNYDWFFASIGRESRLIGSGINERIFLSTSSPAFDALTLGARFKTFEYSFVHGSILALPENSPETGVDANIPSKYLVMHRFTIKPSWGDISYWEGVIYSRRYYDLSYLNPLCFLKSIEHALHDRDNSLMGIDFTVRPMRGLLFKGSYLLDDIIFSEIGRNVWCNKSALNAAVAYSLPLGIDFGFEYTRIEPYTYSHFSVQNSYTNDKMMMATNLKPNSDEFAFSVNWWLMERYPISVKIIKQRHGEKYI